MLKRVFLKYKKDTLDKAGAYRLRHKSVISHAVRLVVKGLNFRLSDYSAALGMEDWRALKRVWVILSMNILKCYGSNLMMNTIVSQPQSA